MPIKTITAEIDGQVRKITADIPEGATNDDIIAAVKAHTTSQNQRESAGYGAIPKGSLIQKGIDWLREKSTQNAAEPYNPNLIDRAVEFLRPLEGIPAVAAARTAMNAVPPQLKIPVGAGVGAATYIGLDKLLQSISGEKPKSVLADAFGARQGSVEAANINALENLILSEVSGKAAEKLMSGVRSAWSEIKVPGSRVNETILKLKGTFSQHMQANSGRKNAFKLIEDIFGTRGKQESIERSAELGRQEATKMARGMSGRTAAGVENPNWMADNIALSAENQLAASKAESNLQAETAKGIAKQNVVQLNRPNVVPGSLTFPANTNRTWQVNGPINLNSTLTHAQDYLLEKQKLYGDLSGDLTKVPRSDQGLVTASQNLLAAANVPLVSKLNPNTGLMDHTYDLSQATPVSFEDAWNWKQEFGELFDKNPRTAGLYKTLNNDIENSITQWSSGSKAALDAYRNAKATVALRKTIIEEKGLGQLIDSVESNISQVDSIISDPKKLQRALVASKITFPSGSVSSSNMRRDLQAYKLMDWINDAYQPDPTNPTKNIFNPQKLLTDMSDSKFKESLNLLYNKATQERISELFKNLAITQQKVQAPGFYIKYAWPIRGGISVAAGIATGSMSGNTAFGLGVSGLVLSGSALARLMINENTGRIMAALAKGEKVGSDAYISRSLTGILRGTSAAVGLQHEDGSIEWGTIDKDNTFKEKEK